LSNFLFTLCFLTFEDKVLLLHRNRPPNAGLWNGVGGHIESGETPHGACLREIQEETGFLLSSAQYIGILTWQGFEINDGGLVLFKAAVPDKNFIACSEGKLAWQPFNFLYRSPAVVSNLHHCAPHFMNGAPPLEYRFTYHNNLIVSHTIKHIPQEMALLHLTQQNVKPE